jgi:hypothetical protein
MQARHLHLSSTKELQLVPAASLRLQAGSSWASSSSSSM